MRAAIYREFAGPISIEPVDDPAPDGVIAAVGADVGKWKIGDRVTSPFVCGCGTCHECQSGNQQVCPSQEQPGFTHWGAFAEFVALRYADTNLVALPDALDFTTAAAAHTHQSMPLAAPARCERRSTVCVAVVVTCRLACWLATNTSRWCRWPESSRTRQLLCDNHSVL